MAAPASPEVHTAAVVFNPIKVNLKTLKAVVKAAETRAGWSKTLWYETTVEDPGGGMTARAIAAGAEVVMAAGGDGTVRAVAEALRGSGVALSLLPFGTGNLLARNLSLSLDNLAHSVTIAFTGKNRPIDVGVVEAERADGTRVTHAFLVMAGLGLDAQMIANTNPALKARVGWLAYAGAIIRSLKHHNHVRVRYSVDGNATRSASVNTVLVGNCGVLTANLVLLPEAVLDDGILDIVAFRPNGFAGWVQIWNKIVWENGVLRRSSVGRRIIRLSPEVRALAYLKGRDFTLRLEHPEEFELDGDRFGEATALKATVDHLALQVRVPSEG